MDKGNAKLTLDRPSGYLRSLLRELDVLASSQMLTFAKHSLQRNHSTPKNPRVVYFNDLVYVGWVPGGVIELAVADSKLGGMFYTIDDRDESHPKFVRETNRCMTCHGTNRTLHVPGFQVRSIFADPDGNPVLAASSFRTNHTSPLVQRWGGWYVTGTHGDQKISEFSCCPTRRSPRRRSTTPPDKT